MQPAPFVLLSRTGQIVAALVACLGVLGPVAGLLGRSVLADFHLRSRSTGGSESTVPTDAGEGTESILFETRWRPVEIDGDGVELAEGQREPFLVLDGEGRLHGFTGCNRLTGAFETDGSTLKLGPLATTRMACPPGPAALEARFLGALEAVASWTTRGRTLELRNEARRVVMRLEERNLD